MLQSTKTIAGVLGIMLIPFACIYEPSSPERTEEPSVDLTDATLKGD